MIKAGLDIGNSKISCVIADYKNTENINILSIVSVPNNNIKKNIILNFENLHDQIKSLVIDAEKQSQTKLNSINLNLSLLNSNSYYYNSAIELKNEKISELHLKKGLILSSFEIVVGRVGSPCSIKLITWLYSSFKSLLFGSASSANKRLEFVYSCPQ